MPTKAVEIFIGLQNIIIINFIIFFDAVLDAATQSARRNFNEKANLPFVSQ